MGGEDDARSVPSRLSLADDDDRVGRVPELEAVGSAELGGVGKGGVAGKELERLAETCEDRLEAIAVDVHRHGPED